MELTIEDYVQDQIHLFYVDFPWKAQENEQSIIAQLKQYFHKAVIGLEVSESGVEHLQCYCEGSPAKYANFIAKWKKMYKALTNVEPTGRAGKGGRRNYGRTKEVKKEAKYGIAYCMKDKNYRFWGYEKVFIERCECISYKRQITSQRSKKASMIALCKQHCTLWGQSYPDKVTFVSIIGENHFKLFDNPMTRNTLNRYLILSGIKTHREYAEELLGHGY